MLGRDLGGVRARHLVAVLQRLDARGRVDAEVRMRVDDARRHPLAARVDDEGVGGRVHRRPDRDDLAVLQQHGAAFDRGPGGREDRRVLNHRRAGRQGLIRGAVRVRGSGLLIGRNPRDGQRARRGRDYRSSHGRILPYSGEVYAASSVELPEGVCRHPLCSGRLLQSALRRGGADSGATRRRP